MDGILNIYKEKGFTSHDAVAVVRKTLRTKKVGHTGTLDPDAEGVLPICVGKATKLSDIIMDGKKTYRAMLRLGMTTTTEDASGEILQVRAVDIDREKIETVLSGFIGEQEQIPPMYSAVKIKGKKLYELAREGKEVERKPRKITIYDIRILRFFPPNMAELEIDCSKGTYIRTLCKDIGESLGCGGHMYSLLRTATGGFHIENSVKLGELKTLAEKGETESVMLGMDEALKDFSAVYVQQTASALLYNGGKIKSRYCRSEKEDLEEGQLRRVYDHEGKLVGLYTVVKENGELFIKPFKMLI